MNNASLTSLAARQLTVAKVLESVSGLELDAQDVIGSDTDRLMQMRLSVRTSVLEGEPLYLCAECFTPVYLCCLRSTRRFFFRHRIEDGRCSAKTRGELNHDEILAKKYNGAKESLLHRQMKQWLVESLCASGQFTDIKQESRWQGNITGKWRQPDVSALYQSQRVAFEVQLSTTFLDVIALRRLFYLKEGGLLFWVFSKFDDGSRRLTMDDVFFNNNQNAFIVSSHTRDASCAAADFRLDCVWAIPPEYLSTHQSNRRTFSTTLRPARNVKQNMKLSALVGQANLNAGGLNWLTDANRFTTKKMKLLTFQIMLRNIGVMGKC
jgi:hypothetical protein